ncbi:MAG: hypothetical protein WBM14_03835 [Terracidiphilus sp.]
MLQSARIIPPRYLPGGLHDPSARHAGLGRQGIDTLNGALRRAICPCDVIIWGAQSAQNISLYHIGSGFRFPVFFEASLSRAVAESWLNRWPEPVLFEIMVPAGFQGCAYVDATTEPNDVKEYLFVFAIGTIFKVVKVAPGVTTIRADYLSDGGPYDLMPD